MLITNQKAGAQKTILIIDDEDLNFFSLAAVLKSRGYQCISANNTAEAFSALKTNPEVSAILMDIMMPGIDGYEATHALKADDRYSHIPIIVLTALSSKEDREKSITSGANGFLSKPVDIDKLMELLEQKEKQKEKE